MKKKNTGNNIRLGVFVTFCLALLIGGIYFIGKSQQLFNNTFTINAVFKDINGLQIGNNVRLAGINVGVVDNLEIISDTSVKVELVIQENVRQFIKKDAKVVVGSDGLMGNKIVTITAGSKSTTSIKDNEFLLTVVPASVDEIIENLKATSENAAVITDGLATIIDNITEGRGTIGKLFMDTMFAENIDKSIVNIKQATGGLKENMDAASHNILLRGYFKRKAKAKEDAKEKAKEKAEEKGK